MLQILHYTKGKIKVICSFAFVFFISSTKVYAAKNKIKKISEQGEEKKNEYSMKPSALSIGLNIFTPVHSYIKYGFSFHNYDLHTSIDINKIFIDLDFGVIRYQKKQPARLDEKYRIFQNASATAPQYDDSSFQMNGKLGFSYNFLHKNKFHNAIFLGVGYNIAYCKDRLSGELRGRDSSDLIYSKSVEPQTSSFVFNWVDIALGLRVSIFKNFYFGHTTHANILKFCLMGKDAPIIPYFIAGYGAEENSFNLKFDFFVGYNIHLWSDPKILMKDQY